MSVGALRESALWESREQVDLRISIDDACFDALDAADDADGVARSGTTRSNVALSLSQEEFLVNIITHTQRRFELPVSQALSVRELKDAIEQRERIPAERQKLLHDGQRLDDSRRLGEYGYVSLVLSIVLFEYFSICT